MKFFISAGEESGEIYGARLVSELKLLYPDAEFAGLGGNAMASQGVKLMHHCRELAAIGIVDILKKIFFFKKVIKEVNREIKYGGYDALIVIDAPELNFRIGKAAHALDIPVFYYVCPQLWAWRTYRVNSVRKWVDTMMVIFPFEKDFYEKHDVNVEFVGHPLLDETERPDDREESRSDLMPYGTTQLVGLMPGSRNVEIMHHLKLLIEIADLLHAKLPNVCFAMPVAKNLNIVDIQTVAGGRDFVKVIKGGSHKVMTACDLLITKSGTSTLEAAIFGTPMIIVYRSSSLSYYMVTTLMHVDYVGLPNLIAGKEVATEYLQGNFTAEAVVAEAVELLKNNVALDKKREDMDAVRKSLGNKGTSKRAAEYIHKRLRKIKKG